MLWRQLFRSFYSKYLSLEKKAPKKKKNKNLELANANETDKHTVH